ncbi:MAG: o-succinylbenzoate synthase [Actinomycetes bacterium]
MPDHATALDRLVPFRVPMRVRFRGVTERTGVLLHGPAGWGEFSPFAEYGAAYAARWLDAARRDASEAWPAAVRGEVEVNAAVPAVDPATARALVRAAGCRTVKVKVAEPGQDLAADVARVAAVREELGPEGRIRVDANGAWDVATAALAIARLDVHDLEYVEQPVATVEELADVRRRVSVPIAADEVIRRADDPVAVARAAAADVLVCKAQPLGGVVRALEVADAAGLPVVVSSALETSVGLAAGLAFAAALPELPYACGLGTGLLLAADVTTDPLVPVGGRLVVRRPEPDAGLLDAAAPDPDTAGALLERLAAADAAHGRYR